MASAPGRAGTAATVRVAVAQTAPELGANEKNLDQVAARLAQAAARGARLVVFPECALSGYLLDDLDEAERLAEAGSEETLLCADFDLGLARQKHFVYIPGRFETHWFADRRPDLYGPLVDPELRPPTRRRKREAGRTD